jgi:carbamoyl-phosphate synthase large subunit
MSNNSIISILITSAGRRVELIHAWKSSARALLGPKARIYANDLRPSLSAACQLADQSFAICRCTEPGYPAQVLEQCLANGIQLVIPTIDTELQALAEARETFAAAGVQVVVSNPELVRQCRDKRLTAALFASLSIPTPKILDPAHLTFPCFMKPVGGSCSQGVKAIPSSDHLAPIDIRNPDNLFQELVPGNWIEYTIDLYYSKSGDLLGCVPRQRLEVRGGEISKGITRKDKVLQFLKNYFANLKGARGVVTLQIFVDPSREQMLGIEINPRFGGGYPMSHAAGANYPAMLIREYLLGESLDYTEAWEANLVLLRHDTMVVSAGAPVVAVIP